MENSSTTVPVVAVALVRGDGCVLMQQRPAAKRHGGLWEFPGGKVEREECPKSAACREIAEELGLELEPGSLTEVGRAAEAEGSAPRHVIVLYTCHRWRGEPQCRDAEAIAWVAMDRIPELAMPPLDYPLAAALISSN